MTEGGGHGIPADISAKPRGRSFVSFVPMLRHAPEASARTRSIRHCKPPPAFRLFALVVLPIITGRERNEDKNFVSCCAISEERGHEIVITVIFMKPTPRAKG